MLDIRNLTVEFGPKFSPLRVIDGVDIAVGAGECVGVVGESGSGKSLTALSMLRLIPEQGRVVAGNIDFDGVDLLKLPASAMPDIRGRDVAMIFQEPMSSLNPVMTIGAQVGEVLKLHGMSLGASRKARVLELLGLVGIPDPEARFNAYPHEFSGGMRQRVMIAIAIACSPRLLIADEPTTALDVTIQAQVLDLMKTVRKTLGMAVLMISHDLGVIADIADRVVVMYAGRVVETGDVRTIFRRPSHPYTQGLLRSIPRLKDQNQRLYQIPGSVPLPGSVKQGCPFYARCEARVPRCALERPPMFDLGQGQSAACWVAGGQAS